jgi:sugar/nucleoside kinase (ribokinase family)
LAQVVNIIIEENKVDVISLGQLVADIVVKPVDGLPPKGTADTVKQIELHSGGCALNTGKTLAILGTKTGVIGKVGSDTFGNFLISEMEAHGIEAKYVGIDTHIGTSSVIVIVSSEGERTFLYCPGATEELTIKDVNFDLIGQSKILHIGGVMKLPKLDIPNVLMKAKELSVTTSLDTDWDPSGRWLELIKPCLKYVDIFTPSIDEAKMIFNTDDPKEIAEISMSYGVKIFALKMGQAGCYIKTKDEEFNIPAYKVDVVDTTGAGDAFVGGFLTGIIKGWNLKKAGEFANAVGALCVTALGATVGVRSYNQTIEFMTNIAL